MAAEGAGRRGNPPDQSARAHRRDRRGDRSRPARCSSSAWARTASRRARSRMRLSLLGILTVHYFDAVLMTAGVSSAAPGDVLLVFSEHGKQPALCQIGRLVPRARRQGGLGDAPHAQPAARARRRGAAGVGARRAPRTSSRCCTSRRCSTCSTCIFVLLCEASERPPAASCRPTSNACRTAGHLSTTTRMRHVVSIALAAAWLLHGSCVLAGVHVAADSAAPAPRWSDARADWCSSRPPTGTRTTARCGASSATASGWREVGAATPITVGRAGCAWGSACIRAQPRMARRSAKATVVRPPACSRIGTAFGYADSAATRAALPGDDGLATTASTSTDRRCTTASSMPATSAPMRSKDSTEPMRRDLHAGGDQRYRLGFVIEHNAAGSARRRQLHLRAPVEGARRSRRPAAPRWPSRPCSSCWRGCDPSAQPVFVLLPEGRVPAPAARLAASGPVSSFHCVTREPCRPCR